MRTEQEMLERIIRFAREDERIRAVMLNGSRVNPAAPRDIFQDYDVVYVVKDVDLFVKDQSWISRFGDILIMQKPDEWDGPPPGPRKRFAFLMQFTDGNRIDLTYFHADHLLDLEPDSLSVVLLDKDGVLGKLPEPSNRDYLPTPPTAVKFEQCCNEFWWVSTYIAKGLWRKELAYAKYMYDRPVRDMLHRMLNWHIGTKTNFSVDPGKCGKYYETHLEPAQWESFVRTFPDGDYAHMWQSLSVMCELFRETATCLASHYGYVYPYGDDERVTAFLKHVQHLPADAKGIY